MGFYSNKKDKKKPLLFAVFIKSLKILPIKEHIHVFQKRRDFRNYRS